MNLNKVFLGGRLVSDPEMRTTTDGKAVVSFSIAVNRITKNKTQTADFIKCSAFGKTAEFIQKYFNKGMSIFIEGRLKQDTWEKDGKKNSALSVFVNEVDFVEKKQIQFFNDTEDISKNFVDVKADDFEDELPF